MNDIYDPPNSKLVADSEVSKFSKMHILAIWGISILYLLFAVNSFLSIGLNLSESINLGEAGSEYFRNLRPVDYFVLLGIPIIESLAALLLLLRKRICWYFWISALFFNLLGYLVAATNQYWSHEFNPVYMTGFALRIGALLGITIYSIYLSKMKILK